MDTDLFSALLKEFGLALQLPELKPDRNNTCQLHLKEGFDIWLQIDEDKRQMIVLVDLGRPPSGAQRNAIYRAAMKDNGRPLPRNGIFAFSRQAESLVLFKTIPTQNLRGEQIAEIVLPLVEKATLWRNAIANGQVPENEAIRTSDRMGLFGMRP